MFITLIVGWAADSNGETEQMKVTEVDTVFVGNSLTEGGDWNRLLGQSGLINQGVSGDTHRDILARIEYVPEARRYFILVGINDLSMGFSKEMIVDGIRRIVEALQSRSPSAVFYLQSVLPVNESMFGFFPFSNRDIAELNVLIERLAREIPAAEYLDIRPGFQNEKGELAAGLAVDGLHLSPAGYEVWADAIRHLFAAASTEGG